MISRITGVQKFFQGFNVLQRIRQLLHDICSLRHTKRELCGLRRQVSAVEHDLHSIHMATAEAEYNRIAAEADRLDSRRLEKFGVKVLSQSDEDGIVDEIFRRIGMKSKTFLEFGTGDGTENNTVKLLFDGWSEVWIDGCDKSVGLQQEVFQRWIQQSRLRCIQSFLDASNINDVIASGGLIGEIDLLSIDVDGNDLTFWRALRVIQPRVVILEYNAYLAPPITWCLPYDARHGWDGSSPVFGASLQAIVDSDAETGYVLVGCNASGLNAFFVRRSESRDRFAGDGLASVLYQPRRWWLDCLFRRPSSRVLSEAGRGVVG